AVGALTRADMHRGAVISLRMSRTGDWYVGWLSLLTPDRPGRRVIGASQVDRVADVERIGRERHHALVAVQTPAALLVEAPRAAAGERQPEVALRIRRRHDRTAVRADLLERRVDALDVDVREHARLAGDGQVGHEVADDVTRAVLEARVLAVVADAPAEDVPVEGRGPARIVGRRDAEVRHPARPEDRVLAVVRRHGGILPRGADPRTTIGTCR